MRLVGLTKDRKAAVQRGLDVRIFSARCLHQRKIQTHFALYERYLGGFSGVFSACDAGKR